MEGLLWRKPTRVSATGGLSEVQRCSRREELAGGSPEEKQRRLRRFRPELKKKHARKVPAALAPN